MRLLLLLLILQCTFLNAQVTKQHMAEALPVALKHPYLFFNEQGKMNILSRIGKDTESKKIFDRLVVEANRMIYAPIESFPPQTEHPRYDSDGKFDQQMGTYAYSAEVLAFLYQLTGEKAYARKAFDFANALSELPTWMIKAHQFNVIYDRVWPWNALLRDDQVVFNYDIRSASIGIEMALVYDWCYDAFDKRQRDRLRNALYEKVILPVRNNYDYQWWATSYKCNWCGICFSGLGVASLALLTEDSSLTDVVAESYNRIGLLLNEFGDDGAWKEGRGYWSYGMGETIYFMESLRNMTNGKFNLLAHERIQKTPVDFALYGMTGAFGDGNGNPVGSTFLINKLVEQTSNGEGAWYRNHVLKEGSSIFDLIWPRPDVKESLPSVPSKLFKSIDWAFMRSDFMNPNTVTIACKAGFNDDPHHGHLDIGQFIVYWQNKYFIKDLGTFDYDEQYFTGARWNYLYASSKGHNLITVNGEQQRIEKRKDQPWEQGFGGKILDFRTSASRDYTLMDPSKAYPGVSLKKWRRGIVLEKPNITLILDEVSCLPGSEIESRFFPGVENIETKGGYTLLSDNQGNTMAVFSVCSEKVAIEKSQLPFLPVKKDKAVEWVPFFSSKVIAKNSTTLLTTIIVPVNNSEESDRLEKNISCTQLNNGAFRVVVKYKNKGYAFHFHKTADGLVLD